jgi:4-amino-4-deoxy-L-arabinose transferase-like glycosyltransferase
MLQYASPVRRSASLALRYATRPTQGLILAAFGLAAIVIGLALTRFVDGDEGFYALAGVLVLDGKILYEDFFYTQMPLLPYVFGAWLWLFGENWYALRALAAVFSLATAVVLYAHIRRSTRNPAWALLAVGLYGLSSLVFGWFPVGKTYAFSTGLLLGGYALVASREREHRRAAWLACGVLVGLAIDTRLLFAVAVIPLLAAAWGSNLRHAARSRIAPLMAGLAVGLTPSFAYFALTPKPFLFDNLGFHSVRSSGGLVGNFEQKLHVVLELLGDVQFLTLLVAAATIATLGRRRGRPISLAFWIALALGLVSLLPTPTWAQYFCVTVPFLIAGCLETAPALRGTAFGNGLAREGVVFLLGLAAALYVAFAAAGIYRYTAWGEGVPGVARGGQPESWKIPEIRRVSAAIDEHADPGEEVLALWPGYIFGTHAEVVPGLETRSSLVAAAHISAESEARYRVVSADAVADMLREQRTRLFVLGHHTSRAKNWDRAAVNSGYRKVASFRGTQLYLLEGSR